MQKKSEKRSWFDLICYVFSFIIDMFKKKQEQHNQQVQADNQQFSDHTQHLQQEYDRIDAISNNSQSITSTSGLSDVAAHLNNRN